MKKGIFAMLLLSSGMMIGACNQNTKPAQKDSAMQEEKDFGQQDSIATSKEINGKIQEIVNGKDGYTATVQSTDGAVYFATISHANLKDPKTYKSYQVGDSIHVKGDYWKSGEDERITVRFILDGK
ncbi:hypothetical protein COR50_17010 [Chitinophaga caeni]|uniref:DUF5666 domain-containing protein n=1 Tax=Chitinophaga caeni TaxID=2029983 RepID=A0A291QXM3_9BACT|nr:hypothetical protein [Chitinophaga caeni]ATL48726.1 hypothetical protein COR50_17010 [Chitinophaga caeni]